MDKHRMPRPLTPITNKTFPELGPGRVLNRIIAENVLRLEWSNKDNVLRQMLWHKGGGDPLFHHNFKPSTNPICAMEAVRRYIDANPKGQIDLLISRQGKKWKITLTLGYHQESFTYHGDDLAFPICLCLVEAHLNYGPKDYEKYGW